MPLGRCLSAAEAAALISIGPEVPIVGASNLCLKAWLTSDKTPKPLSQPDPLLQAEWQWLPAPVTPSNTFHPDLVPEGLRAGPQGFMCF